MNKILLSIVIILQLSVANAQTTNFELLKKDIEKKIELNLWDDVLLLATDLIIEDYSKGDGFYFSALAFHKLGDGDNTIRYLEKARSISDDFLLVKIKLLEQTINSEQEVKKLVINARNLELKNNQKESAKAWYQAWQFDKYKIEYALNAVLHYIDLKDYEKALEILNQPEVYQDEMAKEIVRKLNKTPEIVSLNGYKNAITDGDKNLLAKKFDNAKTAYEEALKFMPFDEYATTKRKEVIEEIAYEKAENSNYLEDTEKYADE